jgi:hypothetical protein
MSELKHPAWVYERQDPFDGDRDMDIRLRTVKIVKTRKPHKCLSPMTCELHDIPAGTPVRYEKAIVDGMWGGYYTCIECLDKWLEEYC